MSYILPFVAAIIGISMIVIIVLVIVRSKQAAPAAFLKGPVDLFKPASPVVVSRSEVGKVFKGSYTLAFYIRIDAVPDMRATATRLMTWPGAWDLGYNAATEELVLTFKQTKDSTLPPESEPVVISGVPLQRWTQVVLTQEGRSLDAYVNGALKKSAQLNNLPPSSVASITLVPEGMLGQLAYVQAWPRRLSISDVAADYASTSDSQGRPFLGPDMFGALKNIAVPNLFCPSGSCGPTQPTANPSQTWEFPYQ